MSNRFDLEQQMIDCWGIVNDIKLLHDKFLDGDMPTDEVSNYLLGLETIYNVKFNQMFSTFERMIASKEVG